nr:mitochondrial import receptor subunit TOM22 homolog [Anolis sagrei ordinatus]
MGKERARESGQKELLQETSRQRLSTAIPEYCDSGRREDLLLGCSLPSPPLDVAARLLHADSLPRSLPTTLYPAAQALSLSSLAVMAAATPLSPEGLLLPKGGAGKVEQLGAEVEEDDDDELDETLGERLWGLTEMFPDSLRSAAGATFDVSLSIAQKMYRFSRAALWIGTTSFMILVLPVVFETEKLQMEQQQQMQQRQILLGPNTGLSGGMPGALPPLPGKI